MSKDITAKEFLVAYHHNNPNDWLFEKSPDLEKILEQYAQDYYAHKLEEAGELPDETEIDMNIVNYSDDSHDRMNFERGLEWIRNLALPIIANLKEENEHLIQLHKQGCDIIDHIEKQNEALQTLIQSRDKEIENLKAELENIYRQK